MREAWKAARELCPITPAMLYMEGNRAEISYSDLRNLVATIEALKPKLGSDVEVRKAYCSAAASTMGCEHAAEPRCHRALEVLVELGILNHVRRGWTVVQG